MTDIDETRLIGSVELVGKPASVREARRYVREVLGGGFDRIDDAELLVSELVTNAVRHSRSGNGGRVTLTVAEPVTVVRFAVIDEGAESVPVARDEALEGTLDDGGRGLALVEMVADGWGTHDGPAGRRVWFELRAPGHLKAASPANAKPTTYEFLVIEPITGTDGHLTALSVYDARRPTVRLTLTPGTWLAAKTTLALARWALPQP